MTTERLRRNGWVLATVVAGVLALALVRAVILHVPPSVGIVPQASKQPARGRFTYDTTKCRRDPEEMVYFAVGRRVFRQPLDNLVYMSGRIEDDAPGAPHVQHPEEPLGCPDHPIQMAVYDLGRVSAMPGDPVGPASKDADAIRIIVHTGRPARENSFVELWCSRNPPDTSVGGFLGCRGGLCNQNRSYEALDYAEKNGLRLAIHCRIRAPLGECSPELEACSGGYMLEDLLAVNFYFATQLLPIEHFIEADGELRRRLRAAEVTDFIWAGD